MKSSSVPASRFNAARPATARHRGFGLLELATSLAFLVILLGLAVSLARYVRATSAEQITRQTLNQLNGVLNQYIGDGLAPIELPAGVVMPAAAGSTEAEWAAFAQASNAVVARLASVNELVCDAWGNAIGYLETEHSGIGMAPHDRPFCFSAGPDGRYLTQDDNLYSYEQLSPAAPTTRPGDGGHHE